MSLRHPRNQGRPRSRAWGPLLWGLVALALFASCQVESLPGSTLSVDADTSWNAYDSLVLTLRDPEGKILETLFHAHFNSPRDLENLPASYAGGKVTVILEGYRGGRVVKREHREYDGRTGDIYAIGVEYPSPDSTSGAGLDIQPDSAVLYLGGRKEVVGPGSAWVGDLVWSSGNKEIVTVHDGELTAVGPGRTYVKAAAAGGQADSSWIRVVKDVPVVDAGKDTSILVNSRVAWSVHVTQAYGTIEMFKWDTDGDGSWDDSTAGSSVGQETFTTTARLYDKAGNPTLRFYARDGEKNIQTAERGLVVASKVPVIDSIGAKPALVSIGDTVRFTANAKAGEGARQAYSWDLDGNGVLDDTGSFTGPSAQLSAARAFAYPGLYRATLKLTDGLGSKVSGQAIVDVRKASPTADAGPPTLQANVGAQVNLTGSATDSLDGRIVAREWIIGSAEPARADSLGRYSFTAQIPGPLVCVFRVTDDDGLTAEDTIRVEILDVKAPSITFVTAPATLTIRDSLAITVKAKAAAGKLSRYAWDFDGDGKWDDSGSVGTDTLTLTGKYRFGNAKVYQVAFRAVDAAGLTATATLPITVKEDRPWATVGKDFSVRLGDKAVLQGEGGDTLGKVVKREWKVGDSAFVATPTGAITITPAKAGDLICIFRVTDDDSLTAQATVHVTVTGSTLAALSDLSLSGGAVKPTLQPAFTADVGSYTALVPFTTDSVRIIPSVAAGSGATLKVKGAAVASGTPSMPIALIVGTNWLSVEVTAQDGITVANYNISVTRGNNKDASLTKIVPSVGALSPPFDTSITEYDLKLDSNTASVSLTSTPRFSTTTVTVNGYAAPTAAAYGPITLTMGINRIAIVATSQGGTSKTYTLKVLRGPLMFLLDDFNARDKTSAMDVYWSFMDDRGDGGKSVVTSGDTSYHPTVFSDSSFGAGQNGSLGARMAFIYGANKPDGCGGSCPYGQVVGLLHHASTPTDMTGATQVAFYARTSAPMRVRLMVETANVLDFGYYQGIFDMTTQWTRYVIAFKAGLGALEQPNWAAIKPFDPAKVTGFDWEISADDNPSLTQGTFYMDDVIIQGWGGP
jgi:hypothetical protein